MRNTRIRRTAVLVSLAAIALLATRDLRAQESRYGDLANMPFV